MTDPEYTRDEKLNPTQQIQRIAGSDAWTGVDGNPDMMQIRLGKLTVDERNKIISDFSGPPISRKQRIVTSIYDTETHHLDRMKKAVVFGEIPGTEGEYALMVPQDLYRAIRRSTPFLTAEEKKEYAEPLPPVKTSDPRKDSLIHRTTKSTPRPRAALDPEEMPLEQLVPNEIRKTLTEAGAGYRAETQPVTMEDVQRSHTPVILSATSKARS